MLNTKHQVIEESMTTVTSFKCRSRLFGKPKNSSSRVTQTRDWNDAIINVRYESVEKSGLYFCHCLLPTTWSMSVATGIFWQFFQKLVQVGKLWNRADKNNERQRLRQKLHYKTLKTIFGYSMYSKTIYLYLYRDSLHLYLCSKIFIFELGHTFRQLIGVYKLQRFAHPIASMKLIRKTNEQLSILCM